MTTPYEKTIEKHSDYNAHYPHWIDLCENIEYNEIRQKISDALNDYFKKRGPDANEDYTSFQGPLMQYDTAKNALLYAFKKCSRLLKQLNIEVTDLISGGSSIETDCRENDPVTGELLHTVPLNTDMILDEIECLIDQDNLSKDDWVWLNFVTAGYGTYNSTVNAKLRQLTRKHR